MKLNTLFCSAMMLSKFEACSQLRHLQKDMRLAVDMADLFDQSLPVAASVNEVCVVLSTNCTFVMRVRLVTPKIIPSSNPQGNPSK